MRMLSGWLCGVLLVMLAGPAQAVPEDAKTVYVVGEAEVVLEPDYTEWVVVISSQHEDFKTALQQSEALLKSLVKIADDAKIDEADQLIGRPMVAPVETGSSKWQIGKLQQHLRVTRFVTLRLRDLDEFDEMLIAVHGLGTRYRVAYKSSDYAKAVKRVEVAAIKQARAIAMEQVAALGQTLGPAIELDVSPRRPGYGEGGLFGLTPALVLDDEEDDPEAAGLDGKVRVKAYASVYFELKP